MRFDARKNPTPTRTTHNTAIEVVWTVIPILVLVVIAIPSFRLMYYMDRVPEADMTLKVTSHQWYWTYAYPDQGDLTFDSNIIPENELQPEQVRLLDVDNRAVVPVGKTIGLLVTSSDVIHSFFVPSLGIQEYAIPGRLNEAWTLIRKEGVYYGQCNQLCGVNHAFMPIAIQAVSEADFAKWLAEAQKKFARDDTVPNGASGASVPPGATRRASTGPPYWSLAWSPQLSADAALGDPIPGDRPGRGRDRPVCGAPVRARLHRRAADWLEFIAWCSPTGPRTSSPGAMSTTS